MALGPGGLGAGPPSRKAPLHVIAMALALVLAAVLGAGIGLVWQGPGLDEEDGEAEAR